MRTIPGGLLVAVLACVVLPARPVRAAFFDITFQRIADTGTPVSVCGELAGRPLEAFALLTLGFTRLSAPAGGVGPVKRMILSADLGAARRTLSSLLGSSSASVRGELESLARKLNVAV